jgi:DNA polymerase-3 subunit delta
MKVGLTHYRRLFKEIERGPLAPLYLFHGPERYIMEELAGRIVDSAVPPDLRSFNLTVAYGSETDVESFCTTARSYPFLADRRILVLKELERLRGSWGPLIGYCGAPSASSTVIFLFVDRDDGGRRISPPRDFKKLERAVAAAGSVLRFEKLGEPEVMRWIGAKARRMGIVLDDAAATAVVRSVGENLYDVQNELEKLALLYDGARVSVEDVGRVIGTYRLNAVFELIDAIGPGGGIEALSVLWRILETGAEGPSVILYHLIRHFLALLKVKAGHRWAGYRFTALERKAKQFGIGEIITWLENLRVADLLIKSTSVPAETVLFGALLHSMNGAALDDRFGLHSAA